MPRTDTSTGTSTHRSALPSTFDPKSLGHSAPRSANGGITRFAFDWTAPSTPGGVVFRAFAVSGNGDNTTRGDGFGETRLLLAYGCEGQLYAADPDEDGFGAVEYGQKLDCSMPEGYAARDGDCEEYAPDVHPDAAERCNRKDDDCDAKLDEGLPIGPQYRDSDGDGYGYGAESIMDCSSPKGYAADSHDCDDRVATTHPDAAETCNLIDDDCDGRTDENVRPTCGVGWCRRWADSCTQSICTPGKPRAEECNLLDDDCDDRVDEDATCPGGAPCAEGRCMSPTAAAPADGGGGDAAALDPEPWSEAGIGSRANANAACDAGGRADDPGYVSRPAPKVDVAEGGCSIARVGVRSASGCRTLLLALVLAFVGLAARRRAGRAGRRARTGLHVVSCR